MIFININYFSCLNQVRRDLMPIVKKNKLDNVATATVAPTEPTQNILDIREHDVPYHVRASIDLKLFVGLWYSIRMQGGTTPIISKREDLLTTPVSKGGTSTCSLKTIEIYRF